jgi:hypothetical protein
VSKLIIITMTTDNAKCFIVDIQDINMWWNFNNWILQNYSMILQGVAMWHIWINYLYFFISVIKTVSHGNL